MTLKLRSPAEALMLFGQNDENLKLLRSRLSAKVVARGDEVRFTGGEQEVAEAERTFRRLLSTIRKGGEVGLAEIAFGGYDDSNFDDSAVNSGSLDDGNIGGRDDGSNGQGTAVARPSPYPGAGIVAPGQAAPRLPGRTRPKTNGQRRYVDAIANNDITFGIGPAGTGKTYLAVAMAVESLIANRVKRIVLTRPAIEAGERLGFLPGDLQAKIDPYLRPLYDALHDMLPADRVERLLEQGTVEVAPLAFMRGRTLNDAFIILDEAQNTTPEQMKMFLTRMGFNSRVVITGDITQTDLPVSARSGLSTAQEILQDIDGIAFQYFDKSDVVRHPLVARIVLAYERHT